MLESLSSARAQWVTYIQFWISPTAPSAVPDSKQTENSPLSEDWTVTVLVMATATATG